MSVLKASTCSSVHHNPQHLVFGSCSRQRQTSCLRADLLASKRNFLLTKSTLLPSTRNHNIAKSARQQPSWPRLHDRPSNYWQKVADNSFAKVAQSFCECGARRQLTSSFTPPLITPSCHRRKNSLRGSVRRSKLRALPVENEEPSSGSADTSKHDKTQSTPLPPPPTSTSTAPPDSASSTTQANKVSLSDRDASGFHTMSSASSDSPQVPNLTAGVNWYCLSMIGLVTLVDFSPLGPILRSTSGSAVPWVLAAVQWGLFVAPTVNSCRSEGYDLRRTFGIKT